MRAPSRAIAAADASSLAVTPRAVNASVLNADRRPARSLHSTCAIDIERAKRRTTEARRSCGNWHRLRQKPFQLHVLVRRIRQPGALATGLRPNLDLIAHVKEFAVPMSDVYPVILSGGSGTRLWPLSRAMYPKQFIRFFSGQSTSFLAAALTRLGQRVRASTADPSLQQRSPLPRARGGRPLRFETARHRSRAHRPQYGSGHCRRGARGAERQPQRHSGDHALRPRRQGRNDASPKT